MNEADFQIINSNNEIRWLDGSPLFICCANLYKENDSNELFANIKFMNIQPETLKSIKIDIICYGIIRNEIARIENYSFENINAKRNECFGDDTLIPIKNPETMSIDIILNSAIDSDGEEWINEKAQHFNVSIKQNNISSYMGRYFENLRNSWSKKGLPSDKLLYAPQIGSNYWLCVCGTFNWSVESSCCKCGAELEWLLENTDVSSMNRNEKFFKHQNNEQEISPVETQIDTSKEQEASLNIQSKPKKRKKEKKSGFRFGKSKIAAFTIILLFAAALTFCTYYFLIPASNYYQATALINEGKYDEAIDSLSKLNGYSDSKQKILHAKYLKAKNLFNDKKYLEAADIFHQIDYSDSSEKYLEAMYKYGEFLYTNGDYISALKTLSDLYGYEDSEKLAEKVENIVMNKADEFYNKGEYSDASQLFMQIYEITKNTDALEKANSATLSQANYLYDTNKYIEALKLYESLSGYDHVDVTLKKLDALKKILSTSIHIGGSSSVWENTTMQCITCHSPTLVYQFILNANGKFTFYRYCTMHNTEDDYEIIKGQYKIEDDTIYILKHNGGSTKWVKFATIENLSFDNTISSKNARLVITNPFDKNHTSLSLYGNIVGENPSPI